MTDVWRGAMQPAAKESPDAKPRQAQSGPLSNTEAAACRSLHFRPAYSAFASSSNSTIGEGSARRSRFRAGPRRARLLIRRRRRTAKSEAAPMPLALTDNQIRIIIGGGPRPAGRAATRLPRIRRQGIAWAGHRRRAWRRSARGAPRCDGIGGLISRPTKEPPGHLASAPLADRKILPDPPQVSHSSARGSRCRRRCRR